MKKLLLILLLIPVTVSAGTFTVNNETDFDVVFVIVDLEGTVVGASEALAGKSGVVDLEHGVYFLVAFKKDSGEIGINQLFKTASDKVEITILSTRKSSI